MATSQSFLSFVHEQLAVVDGITTRPMMGEYCLYCRGVLVGGIYDDRLLIKRTAANARFGLPEEIPYDGAKPMYMLDPENVDLSRDVIECTYAELSVVPQKLRKKK